VDGSFDSCITIFKPDGYEFKWRKDKDGRFIPEHDPENRPRRQELDLPYHENGAFYITKADLFEKTKNRFGGNVARVAAVEMSEKDSLQIDSQYNFWLAEQIMKSNKNHGNQ
jgi:CMP-N-acetylneuraminic acid synthetase